MEELQKQLLEAQRQRQKAEERALAEQRQREEAENRASESSANAKKSGAYAT